MPPKATRFAIASLIKVSPFSAMVIYIVMPSRTGIAKPEFPERSGRR